MTSACGSDNYVCILGDFNAQTADMEDFTKKDTFLSEHFHFDQQTDDFFDQNCALEKYDLDLKRLSKDISSAGKYLKYLTFFSTQKPASQTKHVLFALKRIHIN